MQSSVQRIEGWLERPAHDGKSLADRPWTPESFLFGTPTVRLCQRSDPQLDLTFSPDIMFQYVLDGIAGITQLLGLSTLLSIQNNIQPPLWTPAYASNFTGDIGFVANCSRFSALVEIPGAITHFTQYVPSGTNLVLPDNHISCGTPSQPISFDMCRLAMSVPTSNESEISFEAWFPRNWTGRFLSTGNRGSSISPISSTLRSPDCAAFRFGRM